MSRIIVRSETFQTTLVCCRIVQVYLIGKNATWQSLQFFVSETGRSIASKNFRGELLNTFLSGKKVSLKWWERFI